MDGVITEESALQIPFIADSVRYLFHVVIYIGNPVWGSFIHGKVEN